jgi:hypothetical protein
LNKSGTEVGNKAIHKMRAFDQSNKSKKALKKEAKKKLVEEQDQSSDSPKEETNVTSETNMSARDKLK